MGDEAIFIGYRRDDTADVAGRIFDAMARRFGKQRVFKDVDNIGPGVDFGDYIKIVLPRCRVALVLMGPQWISSADEAGNRRLDDQHDWVRVEIETALATPGLLLVPVLVNGARMPRSDELPESLKPLLRRNAASIRRDPDFHDDVRRLAKAIRSSVKTGILDLSKIGGKGSPPERATPKRKSPALVLVGGVIAATLVVAAALPHVVKLLDADKPPEESKAKVEVARPPETQADEPSSTAAQFGPELPTMVRIPSRSFEVSRTEVTYAQWDACYKDKECPKLRQDRYGRGDHPVTYASPDDANAYLKWLSKRTGERYRLLTSKEWEYAARGGKKGNYSWSDDVGEGNVAAPTCTLRAPNGANFLECEWKFSRIADQDRFSLNRDAPACDTHAPSGASDEQCMVGPRPVGSFQPNGYGLYDMHGNVSEWVSDTEDGPRQRIMGGSYKNDSIEISFDAPAQLLLPNERRTETIGFRVAKDQ